MDLFTTEHKPLVLRPYQRAAVDAVYRHLRERDDNPCVVAPVGSGKSALIAAICADAVGLWHGRVLILAHVKELLEQTHEKLLQVCPELRVGIYSAGLGRRDTRHSVIIAGIQSVHLKAEQLGAFDLVLIDEAHLIPTGADGDGMYRSLLADLIRINPQLRVIGFTATPFRLQSGPICVPPPGVLNSICHEIGIRELIRDGFLSPLRSKAGVARADMSNVRVNAGEFAADEVEQLMDQDGLVQAACAEIVEQTRPRKSVLIFASGVEHGKHICRVMEEKSGVECGFIDGQTPTLHRDSFIRRFRSGQLKFLCNVGVLTTGFDAPNVDCVVLLRPTMSPGLYIQMIGRGTRLSPGKSDCLVLDFGGNVLRHGPVDQIQIASKHSYIHQGPPAKECPNCQALIATGFAACPECGYVFPPPDRSALIHDSTAHSGGVLSGQVTLTEASVRRTYYSIHTKRDAPPESPRPRTMRVEYQIGMYQYQSEWVCIEHPRNSYPRKKAEAWWKARSDAPVPDTAEEAVILATEGALADTLEITIKDVAGEKYTSICNHVLGEKPTWNAPTSDFSDEPSDADESGLPEYAPIPDEDIPF